MGIAGTPSRGRSSGSRRTRSATSSGKPIFGKSEEAFSYQESSVEAVTPRSRSRRSKSYTVPMSTGRSAPTATSMLSCDGGSKCANHAHLHARPSSRKSATKSRSSVSRTKTSKGASRTRSRSRGDIEAPAPRRQPKTIVIEERQSKTHYLVNWCAMAVLAFLLCATLAFLLVKHYQEQNAEVHTVTGQGATGSASSATGAAGTTGQTS